MWITFTIISLFSLCQGMIRDISFEVVENCPLGTIVGNIKISAELFMFKNVELNLENGDNFDDFNRVNKLNKNLFKIDNKTSDLVTVKEIDRETLCLSILLKRNSNCSILQIVSVNKLMWLNVNIQIVDVNDNYPKFRRENVTLTMSEISKLHSTIQLDEPFDLDSLLFGPLTYLLQQKNPSDPQFQLQRDPLKLVLLKELDYELVQKYRMIITACDSGSPSLCGNQTLNIEVINENDEAPVFQRSNYTAIINEDASIGQVILQPKAFDKDIGDYGNVKYYMSTGYDLAKIYFSINPDNGNIVIKEKFLNPTKLKFSIEAKDEAPNPLIGRTWIFLHIVDVNNNVPVIQVSSIDSLMVKKFVNRTVLEVLENNKVPLNLAFVTVTDGDQGENARCTCQFFSKNENLQLITVNEINERNIYRLISKMVFDAEIMTEIKIRIACNDHGEPQNTVEHEIEIKIKDENEHPPTFDQSLYEVEIFENLSIGMIVLQIKVYDRDVRQDISLDITAPGSSYFEINSSGTITSKSSFDYEKIKTIEFYIVAFDRGIKSFTVSVRVSVLILDINDNAPELEPNSNHFEIFENVEGIYKIGRIKAFDKDSSLNGQLNFYLLNTTNESHKIINKWNLFFIKQRTGDIHSNVSLDYERSTLYILTIKVADSGKPPLSSIRKIYIHVKDINDNGPQWQYPNINDNILNISLSNIRDSILTRVRAVDIDGELYNTVNYYLLSHTDILKIDKLTGVITLRSKQSPSGKISILLKAVDAKSKEKQSFQNLIVYIQKDNRPFISISSFSLTFPVLISIIGISSLISIVLVITLFFFCCRKRRVCRNCVNSHELIESNYDKSDIKLANQLQKLSEIPLDLVTDNEGCNNNTAEDSVKLIYGSLYPSSNLSHGEENLKNEPLTLSDQDLFFQKNSKDGKQNDSDYYGLPPTLINLHSPYSSHRDCCPLHSSSDEDSSRYVDHMDPSKSNSIQLFQTVDSTDCMINSYATFIKCGCSLAPKTINAIHPSSNKSITAPFIFNGSAWIPTESLTNENFIIQTKRDSAKLMPLKSIMKKTSSSFINVDSSSSSGQCNDTDQTSSACDSGCILGISDKSNHPPRSINLIEKTYQCKKSQV